MQFARDQILQLEPVHEEQFPVYNHRHDEPIEVKCRTRITDPSYPQVTYWEIEYLDETPNHHEGETRICSERFLSRYKLLTGELPQYQY